MIGNQILIWNSFNNIGNSMEYNKLNKLMKTTITLIK